MNKHAFGRMPFFHRSIPQEEIIDFSKLSDDELKDYFKQDQYNQLKSDDAKLALLQEIENRNAMNHGRLPASVVKTTDPSLLGSYSYANHLISIRLSENPFENYDTVIHEGQHANQYYELINNPSLTNEQKEVIMIEDLVSKNGVNSFYNYYQGANNQNMYNIYNSELNTNHTALNALLDEMDRYNGDKNYAAYLLGRQSHFKTVASEIENMSDDKLKAMKETVEYNHKNGNLSDERYQNAIHLLNKDVNYIFEHNAICDYQALEKMKVDQNYHVSNINRNQLYISDIQEAPDGILNYEENKGAYAYQANGASQVSGHTSAKEASNNISNQNEGLGE